MALAATQGIPCKIRAGDTINIEWSNADYPTSTHSAQLLLLRGNTAASPIAATESNGKYLFTIAATASGAMQPGTWNYAVRYTETSSGESITGETGAFDVLPNLAANQTPSPAQAMLTLVDAQLTAMLASGQIYASVSFNGQAVTMVSRADLIRQRRDLIAEVMREKRNAANMAGQNDGTVYQTRF